MFEREIQYITDFTLNKVRRLGSFFKLSDIAEINIHPALMQYLSADLDYLIFLDRQRLLNKSLFDYSGPEIQKLFGQISAEIKRNKLLPYEEIKKIVQQAVTFNVNFLLRPRWTLKKFVYDTDDFKNSEELRLLFNYSYYYGYYKHYVLRFLEKRSLTTLSLPDFSERINLLTKELLQAQFNPVISSALDDVAAFMTFGDSVKTKLSLEMVEVFLIDRKLEHLSGTLRMRLSDDLKQKYEVEEIKSIILTSYLPGQMEFDFDADDLLPQEEIMPARDPEQETFIFEDEEVRVNVPAIDIEKFFEEEPLPEPPAREKTEVPSIALPDVPELPEPPLPEAEVEKLSSPEQESPVTDISPDSILEEIRKANEILKINLPQPDMEIPAAQETALETTPPQTAEEVPEPSPADETVEEDIAEQVPEEEQEIPAPADAAVAPVEEEPELFNHFTTKETMKIIASVFRNDSIDFVNSIERIAACGSFAEAASILRSIYYAYNISSVNNKEAVLLEDRVQHYFQGK